MIRALILALLLASCATPQTSDAATDQLFKTAIPFCTMIAERQRYVGKRVLVSGLYILTAHGGQIYGNGCRSQSIDLHGAIHIQRDERAASIVKSALQHKRTARVPVVYQGTVKARQVFPCSDDSCLEYSLDEAQLLAARRP